VSGSRNGLHGYERGDREADLYCVPPPSPGKRKRHKEKERDVPEEHAVHDGRRKQRQRV